MALDCYHSPLLKSPPSPLLLSSPTLLKALAIGQGRSSDVRTRSLLLLLLLLTLLDRNGEIIVDWRWKGFSCSNNIRHRNTYLCPVRVRCLFFWSRVGKGQGEGPLHKKGCATWSILLLHISDLRKGLICSANRTYEVLWYMQQVCKTKLT